MSNKSFFVLLGAIISPLPIIWVAENLGHWPALLLFVMVIFTVSGHFRRAKDL